MTTVEVDSGICGFTSVIRARRLSSSDAHIDLVSDCAMVMACAAELAELPIKDALNPRRDGWVHRLMFQHIRHAGCPVPTAVAKALEVELGAALPKDAHITFTEAAGG